MLTSFSRFRGATGTLKRISRARSFVDCEDLIVEVEFALAFDRAGFESKSNQTGQRARIFSSGCMPSRARVEIRRVRDTGDEYMVDPTTRESIPGFPVTTFWIDSTGASERLAKCIKDKFSQVGSGSSIIAMAVEGFTIGDLAFQKAITIIEQEVQSGVTRLPNGLEYVMMAERFHNAEGPIVHVADFASSAYKSWFDLLRSCGIRT